MGRLMHENSCEVFSLPRSGAAIAAPGLLCVWVGRAAIPNDLLIDTMHPHC